MTTEKFVDAQCDLGKKVFAEESNYVENNVIIKEI